MGDWSQYTAPAMMAKTSKVDSVRKARHERFFRGVLLFLALGAGRLKP
jgi:hypothetical protein